MARQAASGKRTPLHTSLPASPVDGQEIRYLADDANGVIWTLRYRAASASAYKWEFVGGPPLEDEQLAGETFSTFGANVWGGISANDPRVTVPLAGDYDVVSTVVMSTNVTATLWLGHWLGAEAVLANAANFYSEVDHTTGGCPISLAQRALALPASALVSQRYRHNGASAANITRSGAIRVTPVRVG